jgi:16S rRNA (cytosine967-C5)-methyltransferase
VADICAGAGGKTLAMAAMMRNQGKIIAHDRDRHRLRSIFERIQRSGATNIEVLRAEDEDRLQALGPYDCVVLDAPCSGSGAWRRKPDAKWRLSEKQLLQRLQDQETVLQRGAELVKKGGWLVYITCSVLPEENGAQIEKFLKRNTAFRLVSFGEPWQKAIATEPPVSADGSSDTLLLTPRTHDTDGFFIAVMARQ